MILELKNATLAIDGKTLFYRLTQIVGSAEMLCIMGETGCGKTSLLRCIVGFQPLDEGHISWGGTEMTASSAEFLRSMMAYVPQEAGLPCDTVEELVGLPYQLRANREHKFSKTALMTEWEKLRIPETLYTKGLRELSGGERQRILLASAAMLEKQLLLVDEPTSALDQETSLLVAGYLQGVARRGATVVAVSHDRAFAGQCDRILNLDRQ